MQCLREVREALGGQHCPCQNCHHRLGLHIRCQTAIVNYGGRSWSGGEKTNPLLEMRGSPLVLRGLAEIIRAKVLLGFQHGAFLASPKKHEGVLSASSSSLQRSLPASPLNFWGSWQGRLQMVIT